MISKKIIVMGNLNRFKLGMNKKMIRNTLVLPQPQFTEQQYIAMGAFSGGSTSVRGWDFSSAVYLQNFSVNAQDTSPQEMFFKPDGTKMYVVGSANDNVNEYDLSTPWNVSSAGFVHAKSVAAQEATPAGVFFKPDGTKMYVVGSANDNVNEYDLSTPWNVSSAGFVHAKSVAAQDATPTGVFFKPDGTKMYVTGYAGGDVNEYDLSTPWDVSSAGFVHAKSVAAQDATPTGVFFKPDGTKMYVTGLTVGDVNEYDLSTPWDVSSAGFVHAKSVAAQDATPTGVFFKPDGTKMYVVGSTNDSIYEYDLSTPWNVSSAGFVHAKSVAAQDITPTGVFFKPDGTKMYVMGYAGGDVNEYDLSTPWNVSSAGFVHAKSVAAQDATPTGVFFKPDGTKMYVTGYVGDVNEYDLSTPWNVSSAGFVHAKSVAAQDTKPTGVFFKPDGTKMYVVGSTNDNVYEYDLSTPWNVSSAGFVHAKSVAAQDATPTGVFFKPDGTKMYVTGYAGGDVNEYDLS